MPEAPQRAWDRFSGCHFAGMNDHDSFAEACEVLREQLGKAIESSNLPIDESEFGPVLDEVFGTERIETSA